ncbi:MAG: T9SS type A sorting domain-containing protein [Gemmatimonadota bacterium]|nr:MAG: T9SS type A sorting domain-containing protein [Gemmatimonadota bacterium]
MRTNGALIVFCLFLYGLTSTTLLSHHDILGPGRTPHDLDAKRISGKGRKGLAAAYSSGAGSAGVWGSPDMRDTVTWRSIEEPDVNFGFHNPGDSLLVWLKPAAACSLIAIRFYVMNWEGGTLFDVWDASRYDPKVSSHDSVDANGWIGTFEPITNPAGWISGLWDNSPLGWSAKDPEHHYWGPFPFTITRAHTQAWTEIPTAYGLQGEVDLGRDPFYVSTVFYQKAGWGFGTEYPWRTPYTFFKFYTAGTGPDGIHDGWFIRSYFMWFEAIVTYYENTPPTFRDLKIQNYTYGPGPFPITVTITDRDAEDETRAGVATAELVYDINGIIDRTTMEGPAVGGLFNAHIPELATQDVVTYWVEATDFHNASSQSRTVTFARLEPEHPATDLLIVWDDVRYEKLDTFFVDLFASLEPRLQFEVWNVQKRNGIDASVINWGWNTIYISGWECRHTLPGRDYSGNLFAEWLEAGTKEEPRNLLYIDQDYFCAHEEYGCDWDETKEELAPGDFMYDYFGVIGAVSDNHGSDEEDYDSVAIGLGDFEDIRINFKQDLWDPAWSERNIYPDWIVDVTDDAEYIFKYADPPGGSGFGAGVRLDREKYRTVYIPWQDYFTVDSLENGDLVPRPDLVDMYARILEWFWHWPTPETLSCDDEFMGTVKGFQLVQNYPNPFNSTTDIRYQIIDTGLPIPTTLKIFNILGQEVRTLVDEEQTSGQYTVTWDRRDINGLNVSSGLYLYRLTSGHFADTKRMILLK